MADAQPNNPLHGITLKALLTELVETHGWEYLADRVRVNCFANEPSLKSSLKFLRKTPWAREKVEQLYLSDLRQKERKRKRNLRRAARRAYAASVADGTAELAVEASPSKATPEAPPPSSEPSAESAPGWSFERDD